ncbi:MAG TPA: helix-turn-helix domain-containing protein [Actinocrinis sp.]|uniref:PucR family transcriptional regulator n=1 Tax=Actinocrinis sp. TaxID=1920516 RepID=UPI002DDD3C54|nr:helix-turn-helix domain-containing protein [Actinocrinis sp.]HEV3174331.1 helix-turn-helix domain-containing protein [Actinocrinis sp.]
MNQRAGEAGVGGASGAAIPQGLGVEDPAIRAELAELAAWADTQLAWLIDDVCAATVERIPFYRDARIVPVEELRRSVEHNLRFLVTALAHPTAPLDLAAPEATGRRRAHQGAPLPEVLQCYRICFTTLWDALVEHARDNRRAGATEALLTAAGMIFRLTDQHALALTEAYRAATAELLVARQQRRSALVEALLTGHPSPDAGPWEAAALLGLPSDGHLVVVAADTHGLAEASLPDIERRLAARGIVSGWRLTPAQQLGVVSLHDDQHDVMLQLLRESARARTGVSPPYQSLADTPRSLHLAQCALAGLPLGRAEVRTFNPSPLAALMVREPDEGQRLAHDVLGSVLGLPEEDRAPLLDTLNAYLDHDGSAERAAEVLYCHPNTVRYRLRRLQELTGRSLSDPHGVAELAAAAYAVRLNPATARWQGRTPAAANAHPRPVPERIADRGRADVSAKRFREADGPR